MPADLIKLSTALVDTGFQRRVAAGCLVACFSIINEGVNTPNHANRMAWATKVRQDANFLTTTTVKLLQVGGSQDTNLQASGVDMTDAQISTMIATVVGDATLLALISS